MIDQAAVSCTFETVDSTVKFWFPNWESVTNCLVTDSANGMDWAFIAQIVSSVAAVAAVFVAVWFSMSTLRRDTKSRAIASHEHWTGKFFLLDFGTERSFDEREDLVQELKTRIGSYAIHLNLVNRKIAKPLSSLASDIRKAYEVETRVRSGETTGYLTEDEVASAHDFLNGTGVRRTYRTYVSACAAHVSAVHARESSAMQCARNLTEDKARFNEDFEPLMSLHKKLLET